MNKFWRGALQLGSESDVARRRDRASSIAASFRSPLSKEAEGFINQQSCLTSFRSDGIVIETKLVTGNGQENAKQSEVKYIQLLALIDSNFQCIEKRSSMNLKFFTLSH